ncbi:MAG: hypothetical protein LBS99_03055, partial [Clostridiales bacterium]|nr:hypothetical protein [Clostridiales bacterium]
LLSNLSTYKFQVKKDITVTAKFVNLNATVTVTGGGLINSTTENTATLRTGENVTVFADENQNRVFKFFVINDDAENPVTSNPYTFVLKEDTAIFTAYEKICFIGVTNGHVVGDTDKFPVGSSCTVAPDDGELSGYEFVYWYRYGEDTEEIILSRDSEYTFTVTDSVSIYAKQALTYELTVVGGYIKDTDNATTGKYIEGDYVTVVAVVPENKALGSWKIGGISVATTKEYTLRIDSADVEITADYVDLTKLATLVNNANQAFNWYNPNGIKAGAAEFMRFKNDGGSGINVFTEGVDYVMYYIYEAPTADKADYVGQFKMYSGGVIGDYLVSADDLRRIVYDGGATNACVQDHSGTNIVDNFFPFIQYTITENFSPTQDYYFAVQLVAKSDSMYISGDISQIGTVAFNTEKNKVKG